MNEAKVGVGMKEVGLKDAQVDFQRQLPTIKNLERVDFVLQIPRGKCIWSWSINVVGANEFKFPNVIFLAQQIMGIPSS